VAATPMKAVMALEPFIGGACFVHNKDRKTSQILLIDYEKETGRLKWDQKVQDEVDAITDA